MARHALAEPAADLGPAAYRKLVTERDSAGGRLAAPIAGSIPGRMGCRSERLSAAVARFEGVAARP